MRLPIYQVDAFADRVFAGNPAAVVPLRDWLPDAVMQAIAAENNLAETAFFVPRGEGYALRWFTPQVEVDLCGHATLASAYVVFRFLEPERRRVAFETVKAGALIVARLGEELAMDFPSWPPRPVEAPGGLVPALGRNPSALLAARDLLAVYERQEDVLALRPDFAALRRLDRAVIATAPGRDGVDFVSRFFAPGVGIDEDPVTGSAHCQLIPYWAERLGKRSLAARQVSPRGGALTCSLEGDRVMIAGSARLYLEGTITLDL
jgi:predicted PhzF superfamily epimerase YddE/YHI9